METSRIDATNPSATGAKSKPVKSAREAFSDLLLSQFDRLGKATNDETGVDETFFQPKPRPVSKDLPLDRPEETARDERRGESKDERDDAVGYVQAPIEARRDPANEKSSDGHGDNARSAPQPAGEPAAEDAAKPPDPALQAKPTTTTPAKPNAAAQAQVPGNNTANNPQTNAGATPPVQVSVTQAAAQAQASQPLAAGAATLQAQESDGGDHALSAPTASANAAAQPATGDAAPNGGFDANGNNSGQPGLGTLAAAIALGSSTAGAAGIGGAGTFAAQLNQQMGETPEPLTVAAPAGATTASAVAATPRRAAETAPQLPRLAAMEQIAINVQKAVASGKDLVTIQLRPEELGRIDVKLEVGKDGQVSAHVRAEKPETLELLQRDARGLERALQDAGLRTDLGSLSFGLRGENRNEGQTGQQQQSTRYAPELAADVEAMAPVIAAQSVDGRVDVHV